MNLKKSVFKITVFNFGFSNRLRVAGGGVLLALFVISVFVQAKGSTPISARDQRFEAGSRKFWASTGGPQGGDTLALVSNANGYVFAGTLGGGVFRSDE